MSFTTTTMFAPRIWGFDFTDARARTAREAGWTRRDLLWEAMMEAGCRAWQAGDAGAARRAFGRALWLTRLMPRGDLRPAATQAALGVTDLARGRAGRGKRRLRRAVRLIDERAGAAIAGAGIAPRARSSLFHLRMEARHRQTYHANLRLRLSRFAQETREALAALAAGERATARLFTRWKGERPTVYDDTRKLLSACLLIPDPGPVMVERP